MEKLKTEVELHVSDGFQAKGSVILRGIFCLHVVGNLKHFIGFVLGGVEYVRDRELEFSARGIFKESLVKEIMNAIEVIDSVLARMTGETLSKFIQSKNLRKKGHSIFTCTRFESFELPCGTDQLQQAAD